MMHPGELKEKTSNEHEEVRIYQDRVTGNLCHVVLQGKEKTYGIATMINANTNEVTAQGPVKAGTVFGSVPTVHLTGEWSHYDCDGIKKTVFENNAFEMSINWAALRSEAKTIPYSADNQRPPAPALKLVA